MQEGNEHASRVDAWLDQVKSLSADRQLDALEAAFAAIWQRAHRTLGDVTLAAIVDRVLYLAREKFPVLSSIEVGDAGMRVGALREAEIASRADLVDGMRFVLVELLTVLGNLTGEILSPALHAELAKVGSEKTNS